MISTKASLTAKLAGKQKGHPQKGLDLSAEDSNNRRHQSARSEKETHLNHKYNVHFTTKKASE